jgi:peptidyl-tRNA hydrolase, PTH1 family
VIAEWVLDGEKIILLKPTTFMNLSGTSVASILSYYKLDPSKDLITLSDDIDMVFAKIRKKVTGSHGGQNGLRDIIEKLWTQDFIRIKIGIGRDERYSVSDWVLSKFTQDEIQKLEEEVFPEVESKIKESI